jgi:hypothetical protein
MTLCPIALRISEESVHAPEGSNDEKLTEGWAFAGGRHTSFTLSVQRHHLTGQIRDDLTVGRKPGNSDGDRTPTYIWGMLLEAELREGVMDD